MNDYATVLGASLYSRVERDGGQPTQPEPGPAGPPPAAQGPSTSAPALTEIRGEPGEWVPPAAPSYTPFTLPEGHVPDEERMTAFQTTARELNLPQAHAQRLLDEHHKAVAHMTGAAARYERKVEVEWPSQAKADPEIGGPKYAATVETARATLRSVATPALVDFLETTGLGNHPEMIRMFARLAKAQAPISPGVPGGSLYSRID